MLRLFLLLILIIIIVLIVLKLMQPQKKYLNYNSTYLSGGYYNPSDSAYPEISKLNETEEHVKDFIKKYVHTDDDAEVIFTSGATEAIANCMFWAKSYNQYGKVVGSRLDHDSVKLNAQNMEIEYDSIDVDKESISLPTNTSMVFITHVGPRTGEIYPIDKLPNEKYLNEEIHDDDETTTQIVKQYRPIKVADVTQSIGKMKIDMDRHGLNAVFFSLHKLSGDYNCGVLVVRDSTDCPFKPLIAGHQQKGMRGGTYNSYSYLNLKRLINAYEKDFDYKSCKKTWTEAVREFKKAGLEVVEPTLDHMYNTILIKRKGCSVGLINELAEKGIYIGASTACNTKNKDTYIRISFISGEQLDKKTMYRIIDCIKKYDKHSDDDSSSEDD